MSRQQLYALASLVSALAIGLYYVIAVIGLPDTVDSIASNLKGPLLKALGLATLVEFVLELSRSTGGRRLDKDERDHLIEGKSYRNAYFVIMAVVIALVGHAGVYLFVFPDALGNTGILMFHALVLALFAAVATNHASRLYFYHQGS